MSVAQIVMHRTSNFLPLFGWSDIKDGPILSRVVQNMFGPLRFVLSMGFCGSAHLNCIHQYLYNHKILNHNILSRKGPNIFIMQDTFEITLMLMLNYIDQKFVCLFAHFCNKTSTIGSFTTLSLQCRKHRPLH